MKYFAKINMPCDYGFANRLSYFLRHTFIIGNNKALVRITIKFLTPLMLCILFIYLLIVHERSNFDHVIGIVLQIRVSGGNRTHDPYANSLAHYPLDYQDTQCVLHTYLHTECAIITLQSGLRPSFSHCVY